MDADTSLMLEQWLELIEIFLQDWQSWVDVYLKIKTHGELETYLGSCKNHDLDVTTGDPRLSPVVRVPSQGVQDHEHIIGSI